MGGVASVPLGGGCCASSRTAPVYCKNPRLKSRLMEMDANRQVFEEVWVFRDIHGMASRSFLGLEPSPFPPGRPPPEACPGDSWHSLEAPSSSSAVQELGDSLHHTIIYMYESEGLRPLRLDWHSDGLCYADGGQDQGAWANLSMACREPGNENVRLKVFKAPLDAWKLMSHLKQLEPRVYDVADFNSKHFCDTLFDLEEGTQY
mmetsp:Transcript_78362/g.177008  ORF Transcript_78362/g.177008 Transcript_78362/m.177008 type:complete len:204 (-) Transcript_78362:100-711(-)